MQVEADVPLIVDRLGGLFFVDTGRIHVEVNAPIGVGHIGNRLQKNPQIDAGPGGQRIADAAQQDVGVDVGVDVSVSRRPAQDGEIAAVAVRVDETQRGRQVEPEETGKGVVAVVVDRHVDDETLVGALHELVDIPFFSPP